MATVDPKLRGTESRRPMDHVSSEQTAALAVPMSSTSPIETALAPVGPRRRLRIMRLASWVGVLAILAAAFSQKLAETVLPSPTISDQDATQEVERELQPDLSEPESISADPDGSGEIFPTQETKSLQRPEISRTFRSRAIDRPIGRLKFKPLVTKI